MQEQGHPASWVCLETSESGQQMRGHANITRAYTALGRQGVYESKALILHTVKDFGFADVSILSSETMAWELSMGYPNKPGILRGAASAVVGPRRSSKRVERWESTPPARRFRQTSGWSKNTICLPRARRESVTWVASVGGQVFETVTYGVVDESKIPLQALVGHRAIFDVQTTPALVIYDQGGYAMTTIRTLANEGIKAIGIQPKGHNGYEKTQGCILR